jgi:RNA polymerase sigma-70 factor (family 1)
LKRLLNSQDILRLIDGDESAFDLVYNEFSAQVYRLAFRFLKDKVQSEEIVQETFIKLWLNRERLDSNGNIWLYLYVIAKRLSLNQLRAVVQSETMFSHLMANISNLHNETEEEVMAADMDRFTQNVISKLPRQQQLVFKLSRVEGLSHQEIAEKLAISPNTVKNHMVQALKTIKANLNYADLIYFLAVVPLLH